MTITTEDAEAFARQLDANEPGVSDPVAIEFFSDVAMALRALVEERDTACRASAAAARAQGVAEGKLAASEMAGVVEGWKARAERAEAEAEKLRDALRWCSGSADFCDGGQAHEGWMRVCQPLLNAYSARAALEGGDNAE